MTMTLRHAAMIAAAIALIAAPAPVAHAWGHLGHRVICAIALMQLDESARAEVDRLAGRFADPDGRSYRYFTQGCTFADIARGKARAGARRWSRFAAYDRWHFLNVPRSARAPSADHCGGDCVLHAIDYHFRIFANHDRSEKQRAEAMLLMSHWIADAHQPLHVAFEDDRGGNEIAIAAGSFYRQSNLHAAWDSGILAAALGKHDWWNFARRLNDASSAAERRRWRSAEPLDWVRESFDISIDPGTRYCRRRGARSACAPIAGARRIGVDYQRRMQTAVLDRLTRAGTRLADYLDRGLWQRDRS